MISKKVQSKTVTSTEAQNNFGSISKWVAKENRIVYITNNRNNETLGLVTEKYIAEAEKLRERERHQQILEEIEELRKEISANLTDEDREVILNEVDAAFREVIEEKFEKGELKYVQ